MCLASCDPDAVAQYFKIVDFFVFVSSFCESSVSMQQQQLTFNSYLSVYSYSWATVNAYALLSTCVVTVCCIVFCALNT